MGTNDLFSALILDDHVIVRDACRKLLAAHNITVVWEGENGAEAYHQYLSLKPDFLIIDLSLKEESGMEIIRMILNADSNAKIIVLSMHDEPYLITQSLKLGALSYIHKSSKKDDLLNAIKSIRTGKIYISDNLNYDISLFDNSNRLDDPISNLTSQQIKILKLLIDGQTQSSIAKTLNISKKTVSNHIDKIKNNFDAKSITDLIRLSINFNLPS